MKFSRRLHITLILLLAVAACNKSSEQPAPEASAPPSAAAPTPPPEPEKSAAAPAATAAAPSPKGASPGPEIVHVPAGTMLTVAMIDSVGTDTNKVGDTFMASIAEPVVVNGKTVLAKGAKMKGKIEALDEPGRVKGKASISLVLTQIVGSKPYSISTEPFSATAEASTKQDAVKVGGGAAVGAIIGAIAGGKKGAAVGAAVGGGAGTATVLATKGNQLRIDSETRVNFVLRSEVAIEMSK